MKSRSKVEARRCRPLLGTFVEIAARGENLADLHRAIDAAFANVAEVQRLMSFHDPDSDVSRMNRDAFPKGVTVHRWTWRVLKAAQDLARESGGAFDVTIASILTGWNYLPRFGYAFDAAARTRDIFLRANCRVFFRRSLAVDLGGIAKGFAVDRAVEALRDCGVKSGIVNAGGDLRAFGPASQLVHLRHPSQPACDAGAVRLRERALATSGIYFAQRTHRRAKVSPMVDARTGRPARELISVSVAAADCMTADALTKVVFVLREKAAPLLKRYHADALLLERDGSPCWMFQPPCDTRDRTRSD